MRLSVNAGLSLVVLAMMATELFLPAEALEYRRALSAREPWRLFTGHFVHLGFVHALLNCVALVLLGHLFADRLKPRAFFGILAAAPVLISLLFLATMPELLWYRGLSGVCTPSSSRVASCGSQRRQAALAGCQSQPSSAAPSRSSSSNPGTAAFRSTKCCASRWYRRRTCSVRSSARLRACWCAGQRLEQSDLTVLRPMAPAFQARIRPIGQCRPDMRHRVSVLASVTGPATTGPRSRNASSSRL